MSNLWEDELTSEEEQKLFEKLEREIRKRKLEVPAIMFFEMYKPWSYIVGNKAVIASPFIIPFAGYDNVNDYSRLLSKRENVEKLIVRLEQKPDSNEDAKEAP